nr:hypothetical protein [Oscillospiraceae bacterium]
MSENNNKNKFSTLKGIHKAVPIILVALAAFIVVCLITPSGAVGGAISALLRGLFSFGAYIIPVLLIIHAICYAEDLQSKKLITKVIFSTVLVISVSCIEYAIFSWNNVTFSPALCFVEMNGGGFIGGVLGFVLAKLFGNVGAIIVSLAVIAVFGIFIFAEKAGSLGKAATTVAKGVKALIGIAKDKKKESDEKKKQLAEDAAQLRREAASEELIDDDFFTVRGGTANIKVKQLGIDEEAMPHGTSPLTDPAKRPVFEEHEVIVVDDREERRRRRSEKPLDLSYGKMEEEPEQKAAPEQTEEKKNEYSKAFFGLDDSADNVFTKDFDPFDFATSEKASAKFASRVSTNSAVTEELDEFTVYEMKANHIPTEREKRLAELERRKKEWMYKKQKESGEVDKPAPEKTPEPETVSARPLFESVSDPAMRASDISSSNDRGFGFGFGFGGSSNRPAESPVMSQPTPAPAPAPVQTLESVSSPAPKAETIPEPIPAPAPTPAPASVNAYSSYSNTKTTYTQPIKTVEFTITKEPKAVPEAPVESAPISVSYDKPSHKEESSEDVAILIAEKIARSNPAYARSANDLKTYTKVVSSPDDELYRQLQGLPKEEPAAETVPVTETSFVPETAETVPYPTSEESQSPASELVFEPEAQLSDSTQTLEFSFGEPEKEITPPESTPKATYARAAEFASALVNEPASPVFRPYSPSATLQTESVATPSEDTLRVERNMLPPTPVTPSYAPVAPRVENRPAPIVEAAPVDEPDPTVRYSPAPAADNAPARSYASTVQFTLTPEAQAEASVPLFSIVEEGGSDESEASETAETAEIQWTSVDEKAGGEDVVFETEEADDILDFDSEEEIEAEPEEDAEDAQEIPPEKQNPDVIKMREMFPFLASLDQQRAEQAQSKAEPIKAEPIVADPQNSEADDVPFDDPVEKKPAFEPIVRSASSTSLVPAKEKKPAQSKKPDYSGYQFPSLDLLAKEESAYDENIQAEIQENADKLIETLASFNVTASIKGVDRGPRITRYEVVPAKGVKVSAIMNLQDDIALNLAAGAIRMEAPIPGKSAVGIEIPNKKSSIVRLRDLLETADFQTSKSKTFVCIGRDVAGQPVFGDIAKMPHLLIAGATGMGKSVCINSLLISVLYKARPDEVKLIMIDPKQVEFTMYNGIPHLLVPVVSDPKQAAGALMWAVEEMERRYNLLNPLCVRNIEAYNEKVTQDPSLGDPLPKIIIVIDEFADLMLQVKDPVETLVMRIAQKARAAGIYLVIGTQRPSVNVITGVIKANVPSRISCKVMSNVDSKTVLDSAGAEKLLDKGDSLYAPAGSPKPHRVQCAFVADGEVESIMNHLRQFSNGESYDSTVMEEIERAAQRCNKKGGGNDHDDSDSDADPSGEGYLNNRQFLDAVEVAVNTRKISTSLIQRKLSIGYGKAAKFIDVMEDMGIVGEANGQRPREVLLTPDEWREKLARASLD